MRDMLDFHGTIDIYLALAPMLHNYRIGKASGEMVKKCFAV